MTKIIHVKKRDGSKEELDLKKFHKVVEFACEDLARVSPSEIEVQSHIQFYDGITTSEIQETLIKSAAELISEEAPNYQFVAGKLINYHLRKSVYDQFDPIRLWDQYQYVKEIGYYDKKLGDLYRKEDFDYFDTVINHDRDWDLTYAAMEQFRGKYLVQDRVRKKHYETPQMAYMLIAMTLFSGYPKETRNSYVRRFYNVISTHKVSLPTPIMSGCRTSERQFSSCVLIECEDSLKSINATTSSIVNYVSKKAGIGIGAGNIRSIGSKIRKGDAVHTGVIPFYKLFQAAVKSCSQGGVRGGSATLYYPIWHREVEDMIVLKNNRGTEFNRVRQMDYGVQFNKLFYERLINGEDITLFSPHDVPGLYNTFFEDQNKFKELYEKAEKSRTIEKKVISALDLFSKYIQERKDTGRIYLQNVDNVNNQGSFRPQSAPIRMSNLCSEIDLPTTPIKSIENWKNREDGEIALCTLSAINFGLIHSPEDFKEPCEMAIRALDELLTYQEYPMLAAEIPNRARRSLGVGINNFAYWLAKNDLNYQDIDSEGLSKIHEIVEAYAYYLTKASIQIAKEKGHCAWYDDTKYSEGKLPIDTYNKNVDELVKPVYKQNWDQLRKDLGNYGIRNSTLMSIMPSETSSQIINSTNGIEPPRALVSIKGSKDGVLKQVVPEIRRLKNKYDLLWDQKSPSGYLKIVAVIQKFVDQGISVNTSYNPKFFENGEIPLSTLLGDLISFYRYGGKQLYYHNTADGAGEIPQEEQKVEIEEVEEEICESCTL